MPQTPHVEKHFIASEYVRDIVIGMSDGLTVPFALDAGLFGAVESSGIIVTAGLAEVAAEILGVYFLFPSSLGGVRKRQVVNEVLGWGGASLPESHHVLAAFANGIGSGCQGYNTRRHFEIAFLIELAIAWKKLPQDRQVEVAAGATGGSHVKAFSGADQLTLLSFMAYNPDFTGGVYVATGDVNGDGLDDIITGAGQGGGPHVKAFNGQTSTQIASFFAFGPSSTGGVKVSAADLNNDGKDDILASLASGGAQVSAFDAVTLALIESFEAFSQPVGVNISGK